MRIMVSCLLILEAAVRLVPGAEVNQGDSAINVARQLHG